MTPAIIGQIRDSNEMAYTEEVRALTSWCQDTNLWLNIRKIKVTKNTRPIFIKGMAVEKVNSFRYIGVHIKDGPHTLW